MDAGFYKIKYHWYCPCDKRADNCNNSVCKSIGIENDIKVGTCLCIHGRRRSQCKECGGSCICEHGRRRSRCKECRGSQICIHDRIRSQCKECGGSSYCHHGRLRTTCRECGGKGICQHGKRKWYCKLCEGSQICIHGRRRDTCKECKGSKICIHGRIRERCKECKGSQICKHNKQRNHCKICDPQGYISSLRRKRRKKVLKSKKKSHTLDDLGMTFGEWVQYLNTTFENRYGRSIQDDDDVHIDEIIPCSAWELPDENKYCWHYLNSQFLLAEDNLSKHAQYKQDDKRDMIQKIDSLFSNCF